MTDRELLEAAAKAAGITIGFTPRTDDCYVIEDGEAIAWWNPLTDDGDALRLAVKLGLRLYLSDSGWLTIEQSEQLEKLRENFGSGDPFAATRRAIVRAASAMANA